MGFSVDNVLVGFTAVIAVILLGFVAYGYVVFTAWMLQVLTIKGDPYAIKKTPWYFYVLGPSIASVIILSMIAFFNWVGSLIPPGH